MIAFDTDVFVELLAGDEKYVQRAREIPSAEQSIPIVVVEELVRGRLNTIRQAESGKSKVGVARAYQLFEETVSHFSDLRLLSFTTEAEAAFHAWRAQKIRVATHDLRIAAICVAHSATLISRNRRDFERIPDLVAEFWD